MTFADRVLGPRIGPPAMGWWSRAWKLKSIYRVLEPIRMRKYRRLTKGTRFELAQDGRALWEGPCD